MPDPLSNLPEAPLPGKGMLGWIGRQFGYVSKALKHDPGGPQTVLRTRTVEEQPMPQNPDVTLRRTTIDEVIVERKAEGRRQKAE